MCTWTSSHSVSEEDLDAVLAESIAPEHAVHGQQVVHFPPPAHLPIPSTREQNGLVACLEESAPGFDELLSAVASLVVRTEGVADELGRLIPRAEGRAWSESGHVVVAQESLLHLGRSRMLQMDQREKVDVATAHIRRGRRTPAAPTGGSPYHRVGATVLEDLRQAILSFCKNQCNTFSTSEFYTKAARGVSFGNV